MKGVKDLSKTNKEKILELAKEINKKEGDGTLYSLGSEHANLKIPRWSTGIEDLDNIIGGGIPEGRVIQIFGPEASGKTTLLYHLLAQHSMALDIPIEGTFDAGRAEIFGNKPKQLLIYRARYGEDAMNKVLAFARQGIPMIGIDSVPSLIPKDDFEKVIKSSDKDSIENQTIGGTARLLNKYLPVIEDVIEHTGTTLVLVNQVRAKMGALPFGPQTDFPGGHKLKHSLSLNLQVARRGWIEVPNKNPLNSAKSERVGFVMKVRVMKSKVNNPMGEAELPIFFDRGFVSHDDIKPIRQEIMKANNEKYSKRRGK